MDGKTFAIIGVGGYIARKHIEAIECACDGLITAALDPHDSVGFLDKYPHTKECQFFTEPERFERHLHKHPVDYVVVCSPNYLHDAHCRIGLRTGADVICEKPVVLKLENLDELMKEEEKSGKKINAILQLRLHPDVEKVGGWGQPDNQVFIDYRTPRGPWYAYSWKGDTSKSGGMITNIGIHLFDLSAYLFGKMVTCLVTYTRDERQVAGGFIELANANVSWKLSVDSRTEAKRRFEINGEVFDLTDLFNDLHIASYVEILAGKGFGLEDAREGIRICESLRNYSKTNW